MSRRRLRFTGAIAVLTALVAPPRAEAGFAVRVDRLNVTTNAVEATLDGDSAGGQQNLFRDKTGTSNLTSNDTEATEGAIRIQSGANALGITGLSISVNADSYHNVLSSLLSQVESSVSYVATSGGPVRLRITVTDTGYFGPPMAANPLDVNTSTSWATGTSGISNASFKTYFSSAGTEFDMSGPSVTSTPSGTGDWDYMQVTRGANPFGLTMVMEFTLARSGRVANLSGSAEVTSPTAIAPAPSVVMMAAGALPFLGLIRRSLRRFEPTAAS